MNRPVPNCESANATETTRHCRLRRRCLSEMNLEDANPNGPKGPPLPARWRGEGRGESVFLAAKDAVLGFGKRRTGFFRLRLLLPAVWAVALLTCVGCAAPSGDDGFVAIFNGRDLTGWDGAPGWWRVEDGALTAQSTAERPCEKHNYLIWRGGAPADFELQLQFRLRGGNSGVQFRSRERPGWDTSGYQADLDAADEYTGGIYEHTRGVIAPRGQKVVIASDGARQVTAIGDFAELRRHFKREDWNDYRIVARGSELTLFINGVLMAQADDRQTDRAARRGILALQMHPGPPMKVQFRNLRLKTFSGAEAGLLPAP